MYEFAGTVENVLPTQTVGQKGFRKREFWVKEDGGKFPSVVPFVLKKDKCSLVDGVRKGDRVLVTFALDGRLWEGKQGTRCFGSLVCVKLQVEGSKARELPVIATPPENVADPVDDGDMPF